MGKKIRIRLAGHARLGVPGGAAAKREPVNCPKKEKDVGRGARGPACSTVTRVTRLRGRKRGGEENSDWDE